MVRYLLQRLLPKLQRCCDENTGYGCYSRVISTIHPGDDSNDVRLLFVCLVVSLLFCDEWLDGCLCMLEVIRSALCSACFSGVDLSSYLVTTVTARCLKRCGKVARWDAGAAVSWRSKVHGSEASNMNADKKDGIKLYWYKV